MTATVEAACTIADFQQVLAQQRQFLAVDPLWISRATVGGVIATNDTGSLRLRYGGGNNAGHTVVNALGDFKLHVVPSGIFDPSIVNVIGTGVVIDPAKLIDEIDGLQKAGVNTDKLFISDRAHVVMPYHIQLDQLEEQRRGDSKIGTTGRGIGPTYADKMARISIRMGDLMDEETLLSRLQQALDFKNRLLTQLYGCLLYTSRCV